MMSIILHFVLNFAQAIEYCELIYIEGHTYTEMVDMFDLHSSVGAAMLLQAKSRLARFRWKKAIAVVRSVIRWKIISHSPKPHKRNKPAAVHPAVES